MEVAVRQVPLLLAALVAGCAASGGAQELGHKGGGSTEAKTGAAVAAPVVVAPEVLEGWSFLYRYITEVEFVLCLEGRQEEGTIYIEGFRLARIEDTNVSSVRYQPCTGDNYVGTAHNHPPVEGGAPLCYRSLTDQQSFEMDRRAVVDIVLCGPDIYIWALRSGALGGPGHEARPGP
ncbi:MAG TPA: hypothetical protein VIL13_03465 [Longimicrobiales bacterium]